MVSVCTLSARLWKFYDFVYRLSKQTYKNIEWVFVDYLYEKNAKTVSYLSSLLKVPITHVQNDLNPKYAWNIAGNRNKALTYAKGEVIVFIDDFAVIDDNFIQEHLNCLSNSSTISCGKMYYMKEYSEVFNDSYSFYSVEQVIKHDYSNDSRSDVLKNPTDCTIVLGNEWTYTGNLCVPMSLFFKTNGFDPRLSSRGEDSDFGLRAGKLGANIVYNPKAKSVNLCTKNNPILSNVCKDSFCSIESFRTTINNEIDFYTQSKKIRNIKLENRYGCDVLVCTICGAEYILNPHTFVYNKLNNAEYVVPKELFNLEEERKKLCKC